MKGKLLIAGELTVVQNSLDLLVQFLPSLVVLRTAGAAGTTRSTLAESTLTTLRRPTLETTLTALSPLLRRSALKSALATLRRAALKTALSAAAALRSVLSNKLLDLLDLILREVQLFLNAGLHEQHRSAGHSIAGAHHAGATRATGSALAEAALRRAALESALGRSALCDCRDRNGGQC